MKLLVVDDELPMRSYLKTLVDWESHGYTLLEAENGAVAVELMQQQPVDLLLLDITMPVMDGLAVLEWITNNSYPCVVTLLTCHDEFCYAKKAIQHGCFDHVLKDEMSSESIFELVTRMRNELSEDAKQKQYYSELEVMAQRKHRIEMQRAFVYWLTADASAGSGSYKYLQENLLCDVQQSKFLCFGLTLRNYQEVLSRYTDSNVVQFTAVFDGVMRELLEDYSFFYCMPSDGVYCFVLWFDKSQSSAELLVRIDKLLSRIDTSFRTILNISTVLLYTMPYLELVQTKPFWDKLCSGMSLGFFDSSLQVLFLGDCVNDEESINTLLSSFSARLNDALDSRNAVQIDLCLQDFAKEVQQTLICVPPDMFFKCCANVLVKFLFAQGSSQKIPNSLFMCDTFVSFCEQLLNFCKPFCLEESNQNKKATVRKCLLLIQQHFSEDISLDWLAERLYMNPSYLSRVFSEEMQQPFVTYLNHYRIEQAKHLIRTGNLKLYEIAERCGFSSAIVFSTIFKKITDQTPTQYKSSLG